MREHLADALKSAMNGPDKTRCSTLRLIHAAIKDRDVANRTAGRDPVSDDEMQQILLKMIKQRVESAKSFDEAGQPALAEQERREITVIRELLPPQLDSGEMEQACREVVEDTDARGLRDVGRCMNALKERYPGKLDIGKASTVVKSLLR